MPAAIAAGVASFGSMVGGFVSSSKSAKELKKIRRLMEKKLELSKEQWNEYKETYSGVVDQMVADAMEGVNPNFGRITEQARTDVATEFADQQDENRRRNMAFGLDPSSGRFQSSEREAGLQEAATSALAQNNVRESARQHAEDQTFNRRSQVGRFGANMIEQGFQNVRADTNALGDAIGREAANYGNLASNLFNAAGQFGGMAAFGALGATNPAGTASAFGLDPGNDGIDMTDNGFNIGSLTEPGGFNAALTNAPSGGDFNLGSAQPAGLSFDDNFTTFSNGFDNLSAFDAR